MNNLEKFNKLAMSPQEMKATQGGTFVEVMMIVLAGAMFPLATITLYVAASSTSKKGH